MSKRKKRLKGMTLIEVIIAMVVLIFTAAILVEGAVSVISNTRASKRVVAKVNEQTPEVENKAVTSSAATGSIVLNDGTVSGVVVVEQYEADTTQPPDEQKAGNLKYFVAVTTTT